MDVEQYEHSRLILIWGSNPGDVEPHFWTRAQEAKRRGAKLHSDRPVPQRHRREMPRAHRLCCRAPTPRWRWG
jgi:predicted molibdopterin-dependent oxidoreductase YjgC